MFKEPAEKIEGNSNTESVFEMLIEMLEYKNSPNFHYLESDEDYDAEYVIEIESKKYPIIGIKILKNYREDDYFQRRREERFNWEVLNKYIK